MRDPDGYTSIIDNKFVRIIKTDAVAKAFLQTIHARELVQCGKLVDFNFTSENIVESPQYPFISYPFEWCEAQLSIAAKFVLEISKDIGEHAYELKDASAWNIIFEGKKPVFCDHLSFVPIIDFKWSAFGQYVRHFLMPLILSQSIGYKPHLSFTISRDGIDPSLVREMMGLRRFKTRHWMLMLNFINSNVDYATSSKLISKSGSLHDGLYSFCDFMLDGIKSNVQKGQWSDYRDNRKHYSDDAALKKFSKVSDWLANVKPDWVIDLGSNTGEYSLLAAHTGAKVISIETDHDAIQAMVLSNSSSESIYPVLSNVCDLSGGRGWLGCEFSSLYDRLRNSSDLILMLAVIHHLAILESIPYVDIAALAAHCTKNYLIVEMIDNSDPVVVKLCIQRRRSIEDFSLFHQQSAFAKFFSVLDTYPIPQTSRILFLMQKNEIE